MLINELIMSWLWDGEGSDNDELVGDGGGGAWRKRRFEPMRRKDYWTGWLISTLFFFECLAQFSPVPKKIFVLSIGQLMSLFCTFDFEIVRYSNIL